MKNILLPLAIFFITSCQSKNTWVCEGDCFNGNGTKLWEDGGIEKGTWKNGELVGEGYQFFGSNSEFSGDSYRGEFLKGYNGFGVYFDVSEDATYTCNWKNGKFDGKGKIEYGQNSKYPNSYYDGELKNGMRHGYGVKYWGDGELSNNQKYEGDWKDDKQDGFGKYNWPNIGTYIGQWREGEQHGEGIFIFPNGDTLKGKWINGYCRDLAILIRKDDALAFTSLINDFSSKSYETTQNFVDEIENELSLYQQNLTYKINFSNLRELLDTALTHKKRLLHNIKTIQEFDNEIPYKQDFLIAQLAVIDVLYECDKLINFCMSNEEEDILKLFQDRLNQRLKNMADKKEKYETTKMKFIEKYE